MKDLKVGKYVIIDGEACKVVGVTHSKPGKHGGAKAKIDATGIFDGQRRSLMGPVSNNVEIPMIDKRNAQVLAVVGDNVQLMDMETYETFELPVPADMKGELSDGMNIMYMQALGKKMLLKQQ